MYRPYSSSMADPRPFMDVQSLIRDLAQDFVTSFNTGNYDHVAALFASDGALMAPHYDPAYGPKAVERLLHQLGEAGYDYVSGIEIEYYIVNVTAQPLAPSSRPSEVWRQ